MIHERQENMRIQDPDERIPMDEPVFLLRGQDITSAETVRFWIKRQRKLMRHAQNLTPEQKKARTKMLELATAHAHRMDDWTPKKVAD